DCQLFSLHDLVHEDTNDVPVLITNVLIFAIYIMRPENNIVQSKHLMCGPEIQFNCIFRNAIRIFRYRCHFFGHGQLTFTIYSNRRSKHKAFDLLPDGFIDQVDTTDQVRVIIVPAYKMRKAFGRVSSKMIDVIKLVIGKKLANEAFIRYVSFNKRYSSGHMVFKSPAQIIDGNYLVSHVLAMSCHM